MRIAKYGHSCLLVEVASGTRILVDPGNMSSVPDDVVSGKIDAVLVTHSHGDHLDETLLGRIVAAHAGLPVFGSEDIVAKLAEKGIAATNHAFADFEIGDVKVEVLQAGHDPVLLPVPENAAYRIGGELVLTGDSTAVSLDEWKGTRVLAHVAAAPWATAVQLANMIERLRPEVAFPVHDAFVIEGFRKNFNAQFAKFASERDVTYLVLTGELANV